MNKLAFKHILLASVFFIATQTAHTQVFNPIDIETAKSVAIKYLINTENKFSKLVAADIILSLAETRTTDKHTLYYIFNINTADGFIIISANTNAAPVLCYTPAGSFDLDPAMRPPPFNDLLEGIAFEMESAIINKISYSQWQNSWNAYLAKGALDTDEMKLNLTSQWSQTRFFNAYSPENGGDTGHPSSSPYTRNNKTFTGCVATAMGQIMYYYQWPLTGENDTTYIDPANPNDLYSCSEIPDPSYGEFTFYEHNGGSYNYSGMVDVPTEVNYDISKLLYNCAVSVKMDWSFCGSWSYTPMTAAHAYKKYFRYDQSAVFYFKSQFSDDEWKDVLKNQIRQERPIQYRGGGHSWVVFGYKTINDDTQFWYNFGWGGDPFLVAFPFSIDPYGNDQGAVVNIFPLSQPDLKIINCSVSPETVVSGNPITLNFKIKNKGSRDAGISTAAVYLSADTTLDRNDTYLTSVAIPSLSVGQEQELPVPNLVITSQEGSYYIIVEADTDHRVHELGELDNNGQAALAISEAPATIGDYRSDGTGDWNSTITWKKYNGSSWITPSSPPGSTDNITIFPSHIVSIVNNDVTVDQLSIALSGTVTVSAGRTLTVLDGPDEIDFIVNGTLVNNGTFNAGTPPAATKISNTGILINSGTISSTSPASLIFDNKSTYQHARNGGSIPTATWAVESDCQVSGITVTPPQIQPGTEFGNFTWNCTSQSTYIYLPSELSIIKGNFNLVSCNRWAIIMNSDLTVDGNFTQVGLSMFVISYPTYPATRIMTVGKDFSLTQGYFFISSYPGSGILNIAGDFIHSGGDIYVENSVGSIVFNGSSNTLQTYTSGGNFVGPVSFKVGSGANLPTLMMGNAENPAVLGSESTGTFELLPGAKLGITSPDGIAATGATGNIRVAGTRTFAPGAHYIYNGSSNQSTGDGLPENLTGKLIIDNTGSQGNNIVTLSSDSNIASNGTIEIKNGVFNIAGNANLVMSNGSTINRIGGSMTASPQGPYDLVYTGNSKTPGTEASGTGLNNVTVGLIADQTLTLEQDLNHNGNFTITSGNLDLGAFTLKLPPEATGTLSANENVTLKIGGSNTMPSGYEYELSPWSTVEYYGGYDQTIHPATYGNLKLIGGGVKTILSGSEVTVVNALTTNDNLTIESESLNSSGSLIVKGASTGTVTYNRQIRTKDNYGNLHYLSSPVVSNTVSNSTRVYKTYFWNEPAGTWDPVGSMVGLENGRGYNMKQVNSSDGLLTFTGSLAVGDESGNVNITATSPYSEDFEGLDYTDRPLLPERSTDETYGGGGWNLLGNPYTSAMDAGEFIFANETKFDPNYQALYLYDGTTGIYKYAAADPPGWPEGGSAGSVIQAGQGFFVLAMKNGVEFTFNRDMQLHSPTATMLKSATAKPPKDIWPGIRLKAMHGDKENTTVLVFNEEMTAGLDPGYDVGLYSSGAEMEIYTALVYDNGVSFARQALPMTHFDENVVPVGINTMDGGVVTFSADVVPIRALKFILEDRKTGIYTDLGTGTYTATIDAETYGTGRFFLYTTSNIRRLVRPQKENTVQLNLRIWSSDGEVVIEGDVGDKAICQVHDIRGHKIFETNLTDGNYNTIDIPSARKGGVYMVTVIDTDKTLTKKVLIL